MARTSRLLSHLRRAVSREGAAGLTDGQLLEAFLRRREEAAFEALLGRHGPMVWAVCRRVLQNREDAEDAFQATFLVLVRKGATVVPRDRVGNWLYGVAYNVALKARAGRAARLERERKAAAMRTQHAPAEEQTDADLLSLLDQELSRLPDTYRTAIVLCDLEGSTRKEAARRLGWPEGTVAGRLARARALLARRLTRRGAVVSGGALAAALAESAAGAAVPPLLVASVQRTALSLAAGETAAALVTPEVHALMEGVCKTMLVSKIKAMTALAGVVVAVGLGLGGAGLIPVLPGRGGDAFGAAPPAEDKEEARSPSKPDEKPAPEVADKELVRLVGTWKVLAGTAGSRALTPAELRGYHLALDGEGTLSFQKIGMAGRKQFAVEVDPRKDPKQMNLYPIGADEDKCVRAVYQLDKDSLQIAWYDALDRRQPPPRVANPGESAGRTLALTRVHDAKANPPGEKAKVAAPAAPPAPNKEFTKRFAGTWKVDAAFAVDKPVTAWERHGYRFDFGQDGGLNLSGTTLAGRQRFTCEIDTTRTPRELVLTPDNDKEKRVRVAYEFRGAQLALAWYDAPDRPQPPRQVDKEKDPEARYILLSRQGARAEGGDAPAGLAVAPEAENIVASRLEGTWRFDAALDKLLATARAAADVRVTFKSDPSVAQRIPLRHREWLEGKRILLAGVVTAVEPKERMWYRFVLIEHAGNSVCVLFGEKGDDVWAEERLCTLMLAPGKEQKDDLLFLVDGSPTGTIPFRRAAPKLDD